MISVSRRRFLHIGASAAAMSGCGGELVLWEGKAFSAYGRIRVDTAGSWLADFESMRRGIEDEVRRLEGLFSLFDPASSLSRLNRAGSLRESDPVFGQLFDLSDWVHRASGGLFDPSIQGLWRSLYEGRGEEVSGIGWRGVCRRGEEYVLEPGLSLSFNGIVQGYATERLVCLLESFGARRSLVNLGEFGLLGGPWSLGVEDPQHGLVDYFELSGASLATSSPGALILPGGRGHILHPHLEHHPVWSSVSVEALRGGVADGLSTAICLMGLEQVRSFREAVGSEVLSIRLVSGSGEVMVL